MEGEREGQIRKERPGRGPVYFLLTHHLVGPQERTVSSPKTFLISVLRRPCHFLGIFFWGKEINLIKLKSHNYIDKTLTNIHVAITQN